jgi:hypothetical protein
MTHRTYFNEDVLSSIVFEVMEYLPPDLLLWPFLREVKRRNPRFVLPNEVPTIRQQANLAVPLELREFACQESLVPDVVLETSDGWTLLVEAELSHAVEPHQMAVQFTCGPKLFPPDKLWFLLLNGSMTPPLLGTNKTLADYLGERLRNLPPEFSSIPSERLVWMNWQAIHKLSKAGVAVEAALHWGGGLRKLCTNLRALLDKYDLGSLEPVVPSALRNVDIDPIAALLHNPLAAWLARMEVLPTSAGFVGRGTNVLRALAGLTVDPVAVERLVPNG